jgi:hypothetical protein
MRTLEDLADDAQQFDQACLASPGIDAFCSSTAWILPAASALMPPRLPVLAKRGNCYFAAMQAQAPAGFLYLEPLELAWGLASPIIGSDCDQAVELALTTMAASPHWRLAILAGMPAESLQSQLLLRRLPKGWILQHGQPTLRHVASLDGGMDRFLSHRSAQFRKNAKRASRKAQTAGITFMPVLITADNWAAQFERILQIEGASWKGQQGVGMSVDSMRAFYEAMLPRLAVTQQARLIVAQQHDRDIGFILGAVHGNTYRGLQFSYHDDFSSISLGSLLQLQQIEQLVEQQIARYDLGSEMDYKRNWAEQQHVTIAHVVIRN